MDLTSRLPTEIPVKDSGVNEDLHLVELEISINLSRNLVENPGGKVQIRVVSCRRKGPPETSSRPENVSTMKSTFFP